MTWPRPRTVIGLLALGSFVVAWLYLADMSTSGCDDGCGGGEWHGDPNAHQWRDQLTLAWFGVACTLGAALLWLLRRRAMSLLPAAFAIIFLVAWYDIAHHARFGPP